MSDEKKEPTTHTEKAKESYKAAAFYIGAIGVGPSIMAESSESKSGRALHTGTLVTLPLAITAGLGTLVSVPFVMAGAKLRDKMQEIRNRNPEINNDNLNTPRM